jgi:hypothetical protein
MPCHRARKIGKPSTTWYHPPVTTNFAKRLIPNSEQHASRENDWRGRITGWYSTEKARFINDETSARRRDKNGYRREPKDKRGPEQTVAAERMCRSAAFSEKLFRSLFIYDRIDRGAQTRGVLNRQRAPGDHYENGRRRRHTCGRFSVFPIPSHSVYRSIGSDGVGIGVGVAVIGEVMGTIRRG